jgi:hypothetical protein
VIPSFRIRNAFRVTRADRFEVALTVVGIGVALLATIATLMRGPHELSLILVVWLEGVILWAVCLHCSVGREHLVRKLRIMLQDRVNNQLTVIVGLIGVHSRETPDSEDAEANVELALTAARAVSQEIEMLSVESLRSWEARYAEHLPAPLR